MTADTLERALTAFARVADLPLAERDRMLAEIDRADPAAAREVRSLLGYHEPDSAFLDPARLKRGFGAIDLEPLQPGMRLRGYTVIERLGSGGSSVVYLAEQERPRRRVALKVLGAGHSGPSLVRRLEREADLLGRLAHPGIAQIYEAGVEDLGDGERAFMALELVEGLPIDQHAQRSALDDRRRIALLAAVAEAVRHAHLAGVVHLDLKPANILVRDDGTSKVLDFGVGRDLANDEHAGSLGVTLAYAAPEQFDPESTPDMRADVFALGVVLFQLMTGRRPIEPAQLADAHESLASTPRPPLRSIREDAPPDLDSILVRALALRPDDRYQSVGEFAEDLRRFLSDRPVSARQDSAIDTLRRAVRRGRRIVAVAGVAAVLLAIAATVAGRAAIRSDRLARSELDARTRAEELAEVAHTETQRLRRANYFTAIGHADAALLAGDGGRALRILETCEPELRDWEWRALLSQTDLASLVIPTVPPGGTTPAIAPHLGIASVASYSGEITLLGLHPPAILASTGPGPTVLSATITHDGRLLTGAADSAVLIRDRTTLEPTGALPAGAGLIIRASPVDQRLLHSTAERTVILDPDRPDEDPITLPVTGRFSCAAWSADGRKIAFGGYAGAVTLVDLASMTARVRENEHAEAVRSLAFDSTGGAIASVSNDGTLRVRDLATDSTRFVTRPTDNKLAAVCWADDDRTIFTAGTRRTIIGLDADSGILRKRLVGHANTVIDLAEIAPGVLLSVAPDGTARVWSTQTPDTASRILDRQAYAKRIVAAAGRVLAAFSDGVIVPIDPATAATGTPIELGLPLVGFEPTPGDLALAVSTDGTITAIHPDNSAVVIASATLARTNAAVFDPASEEISLGAESGDIIALPIHAPAQPRRWRSPSPIRSMTTLNGAVFATTDSGTVIRLDREGEASELQVSGLPLWCSLADPVRGQILAAGEDGNIYAIDPITMRVLRTFEGDRQAIFSLAHNPAGTRLLAGSWDNSIRVHDAETLDQFLVLRGHRYAVVSIAFDPRSEGLFSGCNGGEVMAWFRPAPVLPLTSP